MKNKFIRVLSPITLAVVVALDAAIIYFAYLAIQKIIEVKSFYSIAFVVIEIIAIAIGFIVSKEVLSHGVKFDNNKLEFIGLDDNNIFEYKNIEKIDTSKDTKASLKKNFVDRYSSVIIYQKDGTVTTIELGLTTIKTLTKIKAEIEKRI